MLKIVTFSFFLTQVEAVAPDCRETLVELWMQCFPLKPAANVCFSCPALYFSPLPWRTSLKKAGWGWLNTEIHDKKKLQTCHTTIII